MKMTTRFTLIITIFILVTCTGNKAKYDRPLTAPSGYINETFLKISYGLGILDLIDTEPTVPDDISVFKNIEYKKADTISLQLDVYRDKSLKTPAPVLIFIHGGAWRTGKRADYLPYLIAYAKKGYVTASISYRLVKTAPFPAAAQDVHCAIKWIKLHAQEYGIDSNKIALVGGSAGGHLAMLIGYGGSEPLFSEGCEIDSVDAKVNAIVDLYGPTDLTTSYAQSTYQVKDFMNTTYDENPGMYKTASPRFHISSDDPPTLIFQGTIDSLVPVSQSDSLAIWLETAGVPHEYHRLKGWPHTMDLAVKVNEYCQFYMDEFLKKYL
jgi:acetyl esterase/lipase